MKPAVESTSREEIRAPVPRRLSFCQRIAKTILGITLAPVCWALAHVWSVPGLDFQRRCAVLGLRLLSSRPSRKRLRWAFELIFRPMDSTRYFEHSFVFEALHPLQQNVRHLDVSSPRLVPIMLLAHNASLTSDMINPDHFDLEESSQLVGLLGLSQRCKLYSSTISETSFGAGEYDLVTCVSVLEHISDHRQALTDMWRLLRSGGRLILTLPCRAEASEQWIDRDVYGFQEPDERGFVFWQRFYDDNLLKGSVFSITGGPTRIEVYGEKRRGTMFENAMRKRSDSFYPYWAEPLFMGREFSRWSSISNLPGEGVVALEFIKQ